MKNKQITFLKPRKENGIGQWLVQERVSAGFPSPADDFKEVRISLDRELIKNKESTFFARISGDSMKGAGIEDGDLVVIDRSINPGNNKVVICFIDGEFTVKRVIREKNKLYLKPENNKYKEIEINDENQFSIWGVVTFVIKTIY